MFCIRYYFIQFISEWNTFCVKKIDFASYDDDNNIYKLWSSNIDDAIEIL